MLDKLGPDATLLTIDTNPDFTASSRNRSTIRGWSRSPARPPTSRRSSPTAASAHADYVLSGLPFSTLPPGVGDAIAEATAKVIRPGGAFLVYQFSPKVRDFIEPHFEPIKRGFEWINVPPATLFWAVQERTPTG